MFVKKKNKNTANFFPMPHHEESPEKPQCNMATPPPISRQTLPFCLTPPFLAKNFRPPISINFEKVEAPL